MSKTIGIIGGMGPDASCDLYSKIIQLTPAHKDQDHIHVIIDSFPQIPDRTAYLVKDAENPLPYLLKSATLLENAGADAIVMACNTAHYFESQLKDQLNVPFISIVDSVTDALKEKGATKVAILCTGGTSYAKIYDKSLIAAGIEPFYCEKEDQNLLMSLIYSYVKSGKSLAGDKIKADVLNLIDKLENQGAQAFVLACTELPIAFEQMELTGPKFINSTLELAKAAVNFTLHRV